MEELDLKKEMGNPCVSYRDLKVAMDAEMGRAAESFVRIGYLFKLARDTEILKESGYTDYLEFARAEYGMDKSQVSRFINIHTEFADREDPTKLRAEYQGFGYAKLALMLTLPDTVIEELSPEYSKAEIQAVKDEIEAEKQVSDLEVLAEQAEGPEETAPVFVQAVRLMLDGDVYLRLKIRKALKEERQMEAVQEALAPAGESIYTVRIPGTGRMMISIKGIDREIALINVRNQEKEMYPWSCLLEELEIYLEKPEEEPVAPVQPEKKKAEKKPARVVKAKEPKKPEKEQKKADEKPQEKAAEALDTMPDGDGCQMEIGDFPEVLPDDYVVAHDGSEVLASEQERIRNEKRKYIERLCAGAYAYLQGNRDAIHEVRITIEGLEVK